MHARLKNEFTESCGLKNTTFVEDLYVTFNFQVSPMTQRGCRALQLEYVSLSGI